jgi:hypothetical protein
MKVVSLIIRKMVRVFFIIKIKNIKDYLFKENFKVKEYYIMVKVVYTKEHLRIIKNLEKDS